MIIPAAMLPRSFNHLGSVDEAISVCRERTAASGLWLGIEREEQGAAE
jgi:hypothetical protein